MKGKNQRLAGSKGGVNKDSGFNLDPVNPEHPAFLDEFEQMGDPEITAEVNEAIKNQSNY